MRTRASSLTSALCPSRSQQETLLGRQPHQPTTTSRRTNGVSLSRQQRPESVRDQLRQLVTHSEDRADQATACVQAALESGITTFDTADTYGNGGAEAILGDSLAGRRRESLEILTKVFGATGPGGPSDSGLSRKHIHESINSSLTRLRTDYVDLYQAHRYDFSTPLEETMEAFADVVRAGKALYIGVSEWTPAQLRAGHALARELKIPFISNQSKYNALFRVIEPEVVPTCQELGIGQICFSPIEQGVLTGKYQPGQPVPEGSRATDAHGATFIKDLLTDDLLGRVQRLTPLAEAEGLTVAQLAVAWVLQNDNVASAITGGSRPEQVKDNAAAAGKSLASETLAGIDEALGDAVERDGSLVGNMSPKQRLT